MIKVQLWPVNPHYINYHCPWCKEESMFMGEVVCMECNGILPDIEHIPSNEKERLNFHTEASKGYLG